MYSNIRAFIFVVIISSLLISCGGGGGSEGGNDPINATAEGLWQGTTNTDRTIAGLVLNDSTYWFIYSVEGNSTVIAGVVQGNGSYSNGSFNSANGKDFNFEGLGINNVTVASTYSAENIFSGTLTYSPSSTSTFTSRYDSGYNLTPSLAIIAGTYAGSTATSGGIESATITVSDAGVINGSGVGGCSFTGSATPGTNGNTYNITVTFDGGICANGTNTVSGVAYFDASTQQLTSAALNSARTDGFLYVGIKQ